MTHYDDPAPLGGSFIVTCAIATENTSTMRAIRAHGDAPPANDQREDRISALRQAVKGVCEEIIAMVMESLKARSRAEWLDHWRPKIEVYDNLSRSLTHLARELGFNERMRSPRNRDVAAERFPEAEDELAFIRDIVHGAIGQARQFNDVTLSDELKEKDLQAYCRFRYYGSVFSSCIVSLEYLGYHPDVSVHPEVLETIFVEARSAALQFNHAVMEAGRLREPPDDGEYPDVEPVAIPDDDLIDVEVAISKLEGQAEA